MADPKPLVDELAEALRPFADAGAWIERNTPEVVRAAEVNPKLARGREAYARARAALSRYDRERTTYKRMQPETERRAKGIDWERVEQTLQARYDAMKDQRKAMTDPIPDELVEVCREAAVEWGIIEPMAVRVIAQHFARHLAPVLRRAVERERRPLVEMLKRLQWSAWLAGEHGACPLCCGHRETGVHDSNCELRVLLAERAGDAARASQEEPSRGNS